MDLTDEQITRIILSHKKRLEYDRKRYHEVNKFDPVFIARNRQRAKEHYQKYGNKKRENYAENKDVLSARSSYRYYNKTNRLELFKTRKPVKYQLLVDKGIIPPIPWPSALP